MVKHYCDKCGKELGELFVFLHIKEGEPFGSIIDRELCYDCEKELLKWFKTKEAPNADTWRNQPF